MGEILVERPAPHIGLVRVNRPEKHNAHSLAVRAELAEYLGLATVVEPLTSLQAITGSDRYRVSLWLRRRALPGLPIHTAD